MSAYNDELQQILDQAPKLSYRKFFDLVKSNHIPVSNREAKQYFQSVKHQQIQQIEEHNDKDYVTDTKIERNIIDVEKILDKKMVDDEMQYLIRWSDNTESYIPRSKLVMDLDMIVKDLKHE